MQISGNAAVPSVQVGNTVFTDIANLKRIGGGIYNALGTCYAPTGYQVPAGKKFRALAVTVLTESANYIPIAIGYGDIAADNTAVAPTNAVYSNNDTNLVKEHSTSNTTNTRIEFSIFFEIPAQKFPFMFHPTTGALADCLIWGYELPA